MKSLTLSLLLAVFSIHYGYSQLRKNITPTYPKDEAIAILKENYLVMYFRYPADTVATLDRFVKTLNRIVPIGDEKKEAIKAQALAAVQKQTVNEDMRLPFNTKTEKYPSISWQIDWFNMSPIRYENYIPLLAGNVNEVIKANFNDADYGLIYKALSDERVEAQLAYIDLNRYFRREAPDKAHGDGAPMETVFEIYFNKMFDHYDIR